MQFKTYSIRSLFFCVALSRRMTSLWIYCASLGCLIFVLCIVGAVWTNGAPFPNESTDVVDKLVDQMAELWKNINPDVSKSAIKSLPPAILFKVNPHDPVSVVGCPNGTVPFDLESCTEKILSTSPLNGSCSSENAFYDEQKNQCMVSTSIEPYITCPDGYRVTLPPHDIVKAPCQHSETIPGIPYCDPPYTLSLNHGYCFIRHATLGGVRCLPGEISSGNMCTRAYQIARNVSCPSNFTPKITPLGEICTNTTWMPGKWNLYTQRAVCPQGYRAIVDRVLRKNKKNKDTFSYTDVFSKPTWGGTNASLGYHDPVNTSPRNVSCIKTRTVPPLNVTCMNSSIDFTTYIKETKNSPAVKLNTAFPTPRFSCILLENSSVMPSCANTESRIYIENVEKVLDYLKDKYTPKTTSTSSSAPSHKVSLVPNKESTMPSIARKLASLKFRLLRKKGRWQEYPNDVHFLPSTSVIVPTNNQTFMQRNKTLLEMSKMYQQISRTSYSDIFSSPPNILRTSYGDPVVVNWTQLRSLNDLETALQPFNFTLVDIDWKLLYDRGDIRIICESINTAEFYLTCPPRYALRSDGMCVGIGHTPYILICPPNYKLDEFDMINHPVKAPHPRCVGKTEAHTTYTCSEKTVTTVENNSTTKSNGTPGQPTAATNLTNTFLDQDIQNKDQKLNNTQLPIKYTFVNNWQPEYEGGPLQPNVTINMTYYKNHNSSHSEIKPQGNDSIDIRSETTVDHDNKALNFEAEYSIDHTALESLNDTFSTDKSGTVLYTINNTITYRPNDTRSCEVRNISDSWNSTIPTSPNVALGTSFNYSTAFVNPLVSHPFEDDLLETPVSSCINLSNHTQQYFQSDTVFSQNNATDFETSNETLYMSTNVLVGNATTHSIFDSNNHNSTSYLVNGSDSSNTSSLEAYTGAYTFNNNYWYSNQTNLGQHNGADRTRIDDDQLKLNVDDTSKTEEFQNIDRRLCFVVTERKNAWFIPDYDLIEALYSTEIALAFFKKIAIAKRYNTSPFLDTLLERSFNTT